jgi:hypothetical protein
MWMTLVVGIVCAWLVDRQSLLQELRAARLKDESYRMRLESITDFTFDESDDAIGELIFALSDPYGPVSEAAEAKLQELAGTSRTGSPPPSDTKTENRMVLLNRWTSWFLKTKKKVNSEKFLPFGKDPEEAPRFEDD